MEYTLELDYFEGTKFIRLTQKNYEILNFACKTLDSTYRNSFNTEYPGSSGYLITQYAKNGDWTQNPDAVEIICRQIDKENATHLSVSGNFPTGDPMNSRGIELMSAYIADINRQSVLERIREGEESIVCELAREPVRGFSKFSFASKFCTYVNRYQFKRDDYSIYDDVVQSILPYYIHAYGTEDRGAYISQHNRTINGVRIQVWESDIYRFRENNDYSGYKRIIDNVLTSVQKGAKKEDSPITTREQLDLLLWYYYKGDKELVRAAIQTIGA